MKWALIIVGGIIALVALVAAIGAMLPTGHVAARRAVYKQPPEKVWATITDYKNFTSWRPNLKSVEPLPDKNGAPQWKETLRDGTEMPLEMEEFVPNKKMVTRIANPKLPFGGTWTYELSPRDAGCALSITERGEVYNPIFRFFSLFMDQSATIRDYQLALGKKFGEAAASELVKAER